MAEPQLKLASLISEFEHLAIELDEKEDFPEINYQHLDKIDEDLARLDNLIWQSEVPIVLRHMLLDSIAALRKSIRDLKVYGPADAAERLKDAMGRLGVAQLAVNTGGANAAYGGALLGELWAVFSKLASYAEVVGKFKALPDLAKSLMDVNK